MKKINNLILVLALIFFTSCAKDSIDKKKVEKKAIVSQKAAKQNLNISFLLDLSERLLQHRLECAQSYLAITRKAHV